MERYNITYRVTPQPPLQIEVSGSARWLGASLRRPSRGFSVGAAALLHVAVCGVLLMMVRLPVVPGRPDRQTVALVFAPPRPVSPEPVAPAAMADPPLPVEPPEVQPSTPEIPGSPEEMQVTQPAEAPVTQPSPPELPVRQPSLPDIPPSLSGPQTQHSETPRPARRPAVTRATTPRAKPAAPQHIVETPVTSQLHPADTMGGSTAARPPVADAPIAGEWQRLLATWLAAHKSYPDEAHRSGTEGSVVLRFTVDRSGRVLDVVLVRSAGSSVLDAAAEAMVRNAALPPFTAGMPQETVTVTVQIRYGLTD
jgi:protein TonB